MKQLLHGNEALAEAAVRAGLGAYFGYPITPQTEVLEYLARRMPELDRVFLQAESEVAAINMVYGTACAGHRVMTSTSGPGFSLMQEGLSYIAASEVPVVVANVMRGGPGLGNIAPSQADYHLATKCAGHGDFRPIVLAPASVQEVVDLTTLAFDLADHYRTLVTLLLDGHLGQLMEPAELPPLRAAPQERPWALTGAAGRERRVIRSFDLEPRRLAALNERLQDKIARAARTEVRVAEHETKDAEMLVIAFGTVGRIALSAVRAGRAQGRHVGLLRPISLSPFPHARIAALAGLVREILVVEMNAGQMVDDVRLAVRGRCPVHFLGHTGGLVPLPDEILGRVAALDWSVSA